MKKTIVILPLFFLLSVSAQVNKADSLKQLLLTKMEDTTRVKVLIELARNYAESNPDTSLLFAQQGNALARQVGFIKGEARCINLIGNFLWATGNYPSALEYYLLSLRKCESINDLAGIIRANSNIGNIYAEMGDQKMAISYTLKSKKMIESANIPNLLLISLLNLGDSYEKLNQLDSARIYANQAYELAVRLKDLNTKTRALNNLGNIYSKMHQGAIAMGYYHESLSIAKEINDLQILCESSIGIAELFKEARQADSALWYSRLSLLYAHKAGYTNRILYASSFLSDYFKGMNRLDSAYYYQEITIAAKDSLFSQEKVREVQNLSFMEQIRQQEIAEEKMKAAEERKSNIQMLGLATFISFFFGILFVFSKRKTNRKIIKFLGLLGLLLLFEFISLFLHPYIAALTHHTPILMLLILVAIASILVPLNHKLEYWVRDKLAKKEPYPASLLSSPNQDLD